MSTIITLNDLEDYMGTELKTERANTIINGVNAWVEAYTGRVWGETKQFTETYDFEPVVFLSHIDIIAVESVKVFGETLSETEYKLNKQTGRLLLSKTAERKYKRGDFDEVEVTYTCGNTDVPYDLKTAVLQLCADNYNRRDDSETANVASESLGGYSVNYGGGNSSSSGSSVASNGGSGGINSVVAVLNFYRVRGL